MKKITLLFFLLTAYFGYAQPTTNAADPTNDPSDVISIYSSGVFTDVATNYDPNWGQSGHTMVNTAYDPGTGSTILAYPNFNYQGTELTTQNAAAMEFLHVDIWTSANPANTDIQVSPINNGTGAGEVLVSIAYTSGTWTSVDIPKSSFTGMTWDSVFQMKFAANGPGSTVPVDIYLDNVYFWKAPVDPTKDATLSDLQVDGATITGFSGAITDYTYEVPNGTVIVPQITTATTTQAGASRVITQASAIPGSATVVVTSSDSSTMETYTVNIVESAGPTVAAPTPPARPSADVFSIYSDAYTDFTVDNFDAGWCGGAHQTEVMVDGNATLKKNTGIVCQGIDFSSNKQDLSGFTHIHFDFYVADTDLTGDVFNVKLVDFGGGGAEASALEVNINGGTTPALVANTWVSVDIDITSLVPPLAGSLTRSDVAQIGITTANVDNLWFDNIYLHKNTVLSNDEFSKTAFRAYPNPTQDSWTLKGESQIESIRVIDILGKEVISLSPSSNEATINGSDLKSGIYFAQIKTLLGVDSVKLVKQ